MRVRMERDHARPAIAFLVLVVLAAATVGGGLARQDAGTRRADEIAALPSTGPVGDVPSSGHGATLDVPLFDPAGIVTLSTRRAVSTRGAAGPIPGPAAQPNAGVTVGRATTAPERPRRTAARSTPGPAASGASGSTTAPAPGKADRGRRSGAAGSAKGHPRPADAPGRRTHPPRGRR